MKPPAPKNMTMPADMSPQGGAEIGASVVGRKMIARPENEIEWLMMDVPGVEQPVIPPEEDAVMAEAILASLVERVEEEVGVERAEQIIGAMMLVHGEGYSFRKAAGLLGVSKSHVHNLVSQGVEIMRREADGTP